MNESFSEHSYAIRHKPTKQWVRFENDDLEVTITIMKLVEFKDSTIIKSKESLERFLKTSVFKHDGVVYAGKYYGYENFLEFEIVNVKTTYTIEEDEN